MGRSWASSRKRDVGLATCVLRQVCHSRESAAALNACHLSRSTRMSFEEASRMSELMSGRGYACVECSVVFDFDRRAIRFAFCDFRATTHVMCHSPVSRPVASGKIQKTSSFYVLITFSRRRRQEHRHALARGCRRGPCVGRAPGPAPSTSTCCGAIQLSSRRQLKWLVESRVRFE